MRPFVGVGANLVLAASKLHCELRRASSPFVANVLNSIFISKIKRKSIFFSADNYFSANILFYSPPSKQRIGNGNYWNKFNAHKYNTMKIGKSEKKDKTRTSVPFNAAT